MNTIIGREVKITHNGQDDGTGFIIKIIGKYYVVKKDDSDIEVRYNQKTMYRKGHSHKYRIKLI